MEYPLEKTMYKSFPGTSVQFLYQRFEGGGNGYENILDKQATIANRFRIILTKNMKNVSIAMMHAFSAPNHTPLPQRLLG